MTQKTIDRIRKFTDDRDWDQFHSPANQAKSKMAQNEAKYPVERAKGSAAKYDRI